MKREFPKNFWWGAATSGPQSEGRFNKRHANIFDHWFDSNPEDFHNQVGPDTASNFYNSYKEDIQLMKKIGLNSVRTSIQWSRLIDDLELATLNEDGVHFYNNIIDSFIEVGIEPVMNICHFDLPVELLEKYNGWESKHVIELYTRFAEQCFKLFGDRVKYWFTFNEPKVIIDGGYLYGFHYPKKIDGKKAVQASYNLCLASAKAIKKFRDLEMDKKGCKIGTILNLTPSYPATNSSEDLDASRISDLWCNKLFLDSAIKGVFPDELVEMLIKDGVIWETTSEELQIIKENTIDILGVNYYHPKRVQRPSISPDSLTVDWLPNRYYDSYNMPGSRMNVDRGWEIYPKALYDIGITIRDEYGNIPWFVSENGMGVSREERYLREDGMIHDDYRIQFIKEHLEWLYQSIEEGSNCFGYHMWTPIDCWSWANSYKNRYGFISTNVHTQMKTIKKSGYWFLEVASSNQI